MSPLPVLVETNASFVPSGEYSGRDSVAGSVTSRCASTPAAPTVQISPPDTNAISCPSGEIAGSLNDGSAACAITPCPTDRTPKTSAPRSERRRPCDMADTSFNLNFAMKEFYTLRWVLSPDWFFSPERIVNVSGGSVTLAPVSMPSREANNKGDCRGFSNVTVSVPRLHITVSIPRSITSHFFSSSNDTFVCPGVPSFNDVDPRRNWINL